MTLALKRNLVLVIAMALALALLLPLVLSEDQRTQAFAAGNTLRVGDRGETVKQIQQRLKNWGYYSGSVDGVFGAQTEQAVKKFQRANGLTADGIIGPLTAAKIGIPLSGGSSGNKYQADVNLLARVVFGESRGEPYKGQVAVAAVVLNRVDSASFPNSISGVVYQPRAFSIVDDGQINMTPNSDAIRAAKDAYNGYDPTGGCLFYYNPAKTTSQWMLNKPIYLRIGTHVFCK